MLTNLVTTVFQLSPFVCITVLFQNWQLLLFWSGCSPQGGWVTGWSRPQIPAPDAHLSQFGGMLGSRDPCWALYTVQCSLYTLHCIMYTAHCSLYTVDCTLCIPLTLLLSCVHYTKCEVSCTRWGSARTKCSMQPAKYKTYIPHISHILY